MEMRKPIEKTRIRWKDIIDIQYMNKVFGRYDVKAYNCIP